MEVDEEWDRALGIFFRHFRLSFLAGNSTERLFRERSFWEYLVVALPDGGNVILCFWMEKIEHRCCNFCSTSAAIILWNVISAVQPLWLGFPGKRESGSRILPVRFGSDPAINLGVEFTVVNSLSAFNIIIGRPTLNALDAVGRRVVAQAVEIGWKEWTKTGS